MKTTIALLLEGVLMLIMGLFDSYPYFAFLGICAISGAVILFAIRIYFAKHKEGELR